MAVALLHGRINAKKRKFWGTNLGEKWAVGARAPKFKTEYTYRFLRYGICETSVFGF